MKPTLTILASVFAILVFPSAGFAEEKRKVDPGSIYARLGGEAAIDAAVDLFYEKMLADERIAFFFEDVNMKVQIRKQKEFLSAAFGGPIPWTGEDMRKAHENLDIKKEDFQAVAENLLSTLEDLKVDEALIGEIMALVGSLENDVLNRDPEPAPAN